jgi:hypothetical protein
MAADWKQARLNVARAYDELLQRGRENAALLGPHGAFRVVSLPDGLECRVVIARAPQPGEIRV